MFITILSKASLVFLGIKSRPRNIFISLVGNPGRAADYLPASNSLFVVFCLNPENHVGTGSLIHQVGDSFSPVAMQREK